MYALCDIGNAALKAFFYECVPVFAVAVDKYEETILVAAQNLAQYGAARLRVPPVANPPYGNG